MTEPRETSSPVLVNIDRVLQCVSDHGSLTMAQIAEATLIPRPSVYRLVEALTSAKMLTERSDGSVELATRFLRLGARAQSAMPVVRAAREPMNELHRNSEHTSYLCVRRGNQTLCVDWRQGGAIGLPVLRPGRFLASHAGGASLAMLAADDQYLESTLAQESFPALAPNTALTADELAGRVSAARKRGFSISDEDVTRGVAAIGVAMTAADGALIGALSVSGVRSRIISDSESLAEQLRGAAEATALAFARH